MTDFAVILCTALYSIGLGLVIGWFVQKKLSDHVREWHVGKDPNTWLWDWSTLRDRRTG
jgi:hypothetical protein